MASLMSLLTGHPQGSFQGFKMKDLFDKERWDREQRTWSGQRAPTGPNDLRTNRAGEPMMTNWYRGRGAPEEITSRNRLDRVMPSTPNTQARVQTRALPPRPNIQSEPLSDSGARWSGGAALLPERVQTRETVVPGPLSVGPEPMVNYRPPPNFIQRTLDSGIPGYFGNPNADTVATEEEVEAMNTYRNQMLTDLLAETSEEPEIKAISYYKKKKRSPKTYRSQSRGYRLKRI